MLTALVGLVAVVALIISITSQSSRLDFIQQSRQHSAYDSCNILRTLVLDATPPARKPEAFRLLKRVGLGNCVRYSVQVRFGH